MPSNVLSLIDSLPNINKRVLCYITEFLQVRLREREGNYMKKHIILVNIYCVVFILLYMHVHVCITLYVVSIVFYLIFYVEIYDEGE